MSFIDFNFNYCIITIITINHIIYIYLETYSIYVYLHIIVCSLLFKPCSLVSMALEEGIERRSETVLELEMTWNWVKGKGKRVFWRLLGQRWALLHRENRLPQLRWELERVRRRRLEGGACVDHLN